MRITMRHVTNFLGLLKHGLINGAGETKKQFCIQQAVHRTILDELMNAGTNDAPPVSCVHPRISSLGISLNDASGWTNNTSRAVGLRRFGIAELGSNKIAYSDFLEVLRKKVRALSPDYRNFDFLDSEEEISIVPMFMELQPEGVSSNFWLTKLANLAADSMQELGTEGSKFLWMADEPDKAKRRNAAWSLAIRMDDAARMADMGSDCSFGLPTKGHH